MLYRPIYLSICPHPDRSIKRELVAHTAFMFSFVTMAIPTVLQVQSISYVDNPEFPSADGTLWAGPLAYQLSTYNS